MYMDIILTYLDGESNLFKDVKNCGDENGFLWIKMKDGKVHYISHSQIKKYTVIPKKEEEE